MKTLKSSSAGFSLIEMLVSTGILVAFVAGIGAVMIMFARDRQGLVNTVSSDIDMLLTERMVFRDLLNASPSLNNLNITDDFQNGFFDFFPDINAPQYRGRLERQVTLDLATRNDFYMILTDLRAGQPMVYDPAAAYNIAQPGSPANTGTLTFSSINRNGYVTALNPRLWQDGRVLMLDTPGRVRPAGADPTRVLPRSPIFIGQVQGSVLTPLRPNYIRRDHPMQPNLFIDSADMFLRTAPPMSGNSPVVRLQAVQIVRYFLRRSPIRPELADVYRQTYSLGGFGNEQLLAKEVKALRFERKSVLQAAMTFSLITPIASPGGGR